jgi:hypothetical protein
LTGQSVTEHPLFLYKAFISHCSADEALGQRLARALEAYQIAGSLVGKETYAGRVPPHLRPIFLRAADETMRPLPVDVVNALFGSQFLIVIASMACVEDEQVNKEIRLFKHYHGESRILYLTETPCRLPAAALYHVDADGALTDRHAHPGQTIKWRPDGKEHVDRIVASLLGVGLDELNAANAKARRIDRMKWALVGALLLLLLITERRIFEMPTEQRVSSVASPMRTQMDSGKSPAGRDVSDITPPRRSVIFPVFASSARPGRQWPIIPSQFAAGIAYQRPDPRPPGPLMNRRARMLSAD